MNDQELKFQNALIEINEKYAAVFERLAEEEAEAMDRIPMNDCGTLTLSDYYGDKLEIYTPSDRELVIRACDSSGEEDEETYMIFSRSRVIFLRDHLNRILDNEGEVPHV